MTSGVETRKCLAKNNKKFISSARAEKTFCHPDICLNVFFYLKITEP